ncbi:MAG: hypothetical protein QXZ06_07065 [Candidatus Jordarchaeales archaeon]
MKLTLPSSKSPYSPKKFKFFLFDRKLPNSTQIIVQNFAGHLLFTPTHFMFRTDASSDSSSHSGVARKTSPKGFRQ